MNIKYKMANQAIKVNRGRSITVKNLTGVNAAVELVELSDTIAMLQIKLPLRIGVNGVAYVPVETDPVDMEIGDIECKNWRYKKSKSNYIFCK